MRFIFILILFFSSGMSLSWAEKNNTSKKGKKISTVKTSIQNIKNRRGQLSQQLRSIEIEYGQTTSSLKDLREKINEKHRRLKEIKAVVKTRHDELIFQNKELSGQMKAAYVMGKKEKLRLLLNQQDPVLASRMVMYYNYLNNARLKRLTAIQTHLKILEKLLEERERESELLKQAIQLRKTKQFTLVETKKQRNMVLSQLEMDFNSKSEQLNHLQKSKKTLQDLVVNLDSSSPQAESLLIKPKTDDKSAEIIETKADIILTDKKLISQPNKIASYESTGLPFDQQKGTLPWPIRGKIIKSFGSKRSDTRWDGVLISAREGTNIRAVTNGRVVFADWMRGYGLLVIIDHGKNYMTLYAFNQSIYKKVGDQVKTGSVIASVGKSGGRHTAGLYFGVRRKGKPVNPSKWCRKIKNGNVG